MAQSSFAISEGAISESGPGGASSSSAPGLQELLDSGDYTICAEQRLTTIGTDYEHILIVGTSGFTTLSTDTPASYAVAAILDGDILVNRTVAITENSSLVGDQSGEVRMLVPAIGVSLHTIGQGNSTEPLSVLRTQRQCGGQLFKLKIGRPEFGYDSFHTVFTTYAESMSPDGTTHVRLELRDYGRNLDIGILGTFAGTGGEEGTTDLTGEVRAKHYGAPRNLTPRLALPTTLTYHVSDRTPTASIADVYDGGVALTEDTSGYPFANWAAFQAHTIAAGGWVQWLGWIRLETSPVSVITLDMADTMTVPAIIRAMLEDAGVPAADILIETEGYDYGVDNGRSDDWQTFAEMLNDAPAQAYVAAQENVIDAVDRIAKTHGLSRYQDREGRLHFGILDYRLNGDAIVGTDYIVISSGDNIELEPAALPGTVWPPNFREYALYDQNHTVMTSDQVLAGAPDAFRQSAIVDGRTLYYPDVTPETSPVLLGLPNAVDPPRNDSALTTQADAEELATWFNTRSALTRTTGAAFLSQRRMFRMSMPISTGYAIDFMNPIKITVDNYWPDAALTAVGQFLPPSENWSTGMMEFDFYPYGLGYFSIFLTETQGETPGTSLDGARSVFVSGNYAYVACFGRDSLAVIDITTPTSPAWVTEIRGPSPGTSLGGAISVFVSGNYAYVACFDHDSLAVIDITTPTSPAWVTEITDASLDAATCVFVLGNYAYVTSFEHDALVVIDITTPSSPVIVGETQGPVPGTSLDGANGVYVVDNYAYVVCSRANNLVVVDISNPASPTWVAETYGPNPGNSLSGATGIFVSGGYAYIACLTGDNVAVVDVSSPTEPSWTAEITGAQFDAATGIFVAGDYVYIACSNRDSLAIVG